MRRQPQARGTKAKYRIDAFYELEKKAKQTREQGKVNLDVKASYIGSKIFEAKDVTKSFGDLKITDHFNYTFARYEKMGIVGNNGTGKSTFIKMLMGEVAPDSGHFDVGETVRFGYYSQEGLQFDEQMKVIDVVQKIAEYIDLGDGRKLGVSQFLNYFLFTPDKQHNYVYKLSGGEKRRLYLCTVLMRNPNFLVLDEPTNDLDIITLNVLEEYLRSFKGCLIVVSHDRYFMDKVVDHLLVFHGNADIQDFPGNYTQYRAWKEERDAARAEAVAAAMEKLFETRQVKNEFFTLDLPRGWVLFKDAATPDGGVRVEALNTDGISVIITVLRSFDDDDKTAAQDRKEMKNWEKRNGRQFITYTGKLKSVPVDCDEIKAARQIGISFGD